MPTRSYGLSIWTPSRKQRRSVEPEAGVGRADDHQIVIRSVHRTERTDSGYDSTGDNLTSDRNHPFASAPIAISFPLGSSFGPVQSQLYNSPPQWEGGPLAVHAPSSKMQSFFIPESIETSVNYRSLRSNENESRYVCEQTCPKRNIACDFVSETMLELQAHEAQVHNLEISQEDKLRQPRLNRPKAKRQMSYVSVVECTDNLDADEAQADRVEELGKECSSEPVSETSVCSHTDRIASPHTDSRSNDLPKHEPQEHMPATTSMSTPVLEDGESNTILGSSQQMAALNMEALAQALRTSRDNACLSQTPTVCHVNTLASSPAPSLSTQCKVPKPIKLSDGTGTPLSNAESTDIAPLRSAKRALHEMDPADIQMHQSSAKTVKLRQVKPGLAESLSTASQSQEDVFERNSADKHDLGDDVDAFVPLAPKPMTTAARRPHCSGWSKDDQHYGEDKKVSAEDAADTEMASLSSPGDCAVVSTDSQNIDTYDSMESGIDTNDDESSVYSGLSQYSRELNAADEVVFVQMNKAVIMEKFLDDVLDCTEIFIGNFLANDGPSDVDGEGPSNAVSDGDNTGSRPSDPLSMQSNNGQWIDRSNRRKHGRSDGGGDEEEEDDRRPKEVKMTPKDRVLELLMCPFRKHQPNFGLRNSCKSPYDSIGRLREHLFRVHKCPMYYCTRCKEEFKDNQSLNAHLLKEKNSLCEESEDQGPLDGLSTQQVADIKKVQHPRGQNLAPSWREIYCIIFPDDEVIPEPWFDAMLDQAEAVDDVYLQLRERLPEAMDDAFEVHNIDTSLKITQEFRTNLKKCVMDVVEHAIESCKLAFERQQTTTDRRKRRPNSGTAMRPQLDMSQSAQLLQVPTPISNRSLSFQQHRPRESFSSTGGDSFKFSSAFRQQVHASALAGQATSSGARSDASFEITGQTSNLPLVQPSLGAPSSMIWGMPTGDQAGGGQRVIDTPATAGFNGNSAIPLDRDYGLYADGAQFDKQPADYSNNQHGQPTYHYAETNFPQMIVNQQHQFGDTIGSYGINAADMGAPGLAGPPPFVPDPPTQPWSEFYPRGQGQSSNSFASNAR